jgi:hypothetical protein
MDVIIIWIEGHVSPQHVWKIDIEKKGIAFVLDAAAEARLRGVGATDDWIAMLKGARVVMVAAPQALDSLESTGVGERQYSLSELLPLYYDRGLRVETYVTVASLQETGGAVNGQQIQTSNGPVTLQSVPLPASQQIYGLVVGSATTALNIEGLFQPGIMMINLGIAFDPFIPLGRTGMRVILGATPFLGDTRQILGHVAHAPSDTSYNAIELHNAVLGGDVRGGLAYHWRPSHYLYAELDYRFVATVNRQLEVPGSQTVTQGIPWSSWGARGGILRIGIGF